MTNNLLIIGAGKVGCNIARLARQHGTPVSLWDREEPPAAAREALDGLPLLVGEEPTGAFSHVLLAVPESELAEAATVAVGWESTRDAVLAHTAGSVGAVPAGNREVGVCHPAFAFPGHSLPMPRLQRLAFLLAGTEVTTAAFGRLLERWQVTAVAAAAERDSALYHSGCVVASNVLAWLGVVAGELFGAAGVPESGRNPLLLSLMTSVLDQAGTEGFATALTGPACRGDVVTLQAEATRIAQERPEFFNLFVEANLAILERCGHTDATREFLAWLDTDDEVNSLW